MPRTTIDDLLAQARARLERVGPEEALAAVEDGGTLIDIRPENLVRRDGTIPQALIIHRNVLEWRLDPDSGASHPQAPALDDRVMVICNEGYTSSLAAASLHDLGFARATDVAGGFQRWRELGLPVTPPGEAG